MRRDGETGGQVIEQVTTLLEVTDVNLAVEFRMSVAPSEGNGFIAESAAAALAGLLRGVIEAESFEQRLRAEAEAYAKERVRSERQVGFGAPQPPSG